MGICAQRNTRSVLSRNFEEVDIQILSIGIAVNFQCLIELGSFRKDARPVCFQTKPVIIDAAARVAEDLNVRIAQRCKISLGLIFKCPQRGVE